MRIFSAIASKKITSAGKFLFAAFVSFTLLACVYSVNKIYLTSPTQNTYCYNDNNFYVFNLNIPVDLNFCGENIPSDDYHIREALEKEFFANSYWKSNSVILFRRVQKWFPYIEPILKQEGVPLDFKYMAFIESHLTNATSPAGASGFWQLVPVSARHYGLVVNNEVDERYSVEKSTRAACKHIKAAYAVFKNWTLAAAAYNLGINGVIYELKRQKADNYFSLILNSETGSFVYRILAYKTLFSNPAHFGIRKKIKYYPKIPFKRYNTDSTLIVINDYAKSIGVNKKIIKLYNPWILSDTIHNPENHVYEIRVPKNLNADYSSYLADLNIDRSNSLIFTPFESGAVSTLSLSETAEAKYDSLKSKMVQKTVFHIVKKETEALDSIADKYSVATEDIRKWNHFGNTECVEKGKIITIHFYEPK